MKPLKSKSILIRFAAVLIWFSLSAKFSFAQIKLDSLVYIHISDTHLSNPNNYESNLVKRREHYGNGYVKFKNFLAGIPQKYHADNIVITGDIIDFFEGETPKGNLRSGQEDLFAKVYPASPVPLLLTLGNHDISTYWSGIDKNKKSDQHNSAFARAAWIRNIPCFNKGTYYSKRYNIGGTKYLILFLDVTYLLPDNPLYAYWSPEMIEWINHQLEENKDAKCVLFFHVPIPVADNNKDGVFLFEPKKGWPNKDSYQLGIMKVLNDNPSIKLMFVGHMHDNVIEDIDFPDGHKITEIETGAFAVDENNWRVIKFKPDVIEVSKPGSNRIELTVSVE